MARPDDPNRSEVLVIYHGDIDRVSGIVDMAGAARERLAWPGSMELYMLPVILILLYICRSHKI